MSSFLFAFFLLSCTSSSDETDEKSPVISENRIQKTVLNDETYDYLYTINQSGLDEMLKRGHSDVERETGNLKIFAKGRLCSFNIYVIDRDGFYIPVFSTSEEFTGTSFYLQAGKKIYKLSGGSGVNIGARETPSGIQIAYKIPKVAQVFVDFTCFASNENKDGDMIKVNAAVKNLKGRKEIFSLKLVMDTVIGEKSKYHFYTSDNKSITKEKMYRSFRDLKWMVTGNEQTSFQILLNGADIFTPEFVSIANFETLNTMALEPTVLSTRSFDTVSSYNNSACCVGWPGVYCEPDEQKSFTIYFAIATFPEYLTSDDFMAYLSSRAKKATSAERIAESGINIDEAGDGVLIGSDSWSDHDPDGILSRVLEDGTLPFDIEYIQHLLNRISELEESGKEVDEEELLLLNQELDEVLAQLKENN